MQRIIATILVLLAAAAFAATTLPSTAPTTSPAIVLQNVVVRDTDAKAPTTQAITSGGYVAGGLPRHWTLQFNFASTQPGSVSFTIDGKQPHVEYYVPWVCEGDDVPIDLPVGDHLIGYSVNGQTPQAFAVSVLPPPVFGQNMEGVSTAAGDPGGTSAVGVDQFGAEFFRRAIVAREGSFTGQQPPGYFKISKAWQSAGVKVFAVANFQNAAPRCSAPADKDWISYWTNFPAPARNRHLCHLPGQ